MLTPPFFFFNDTATTEIYTLSLHDALPIYIGRSEVVEALVVTPGVVVIDELGDARFQLTGQVVVLEQDLVLHGAVVALDLALRHRVIGLAPGVRHAMFP